MRLKQVKKESDLTEKERKQLSLKIRKMLATPKAGVNCFGTGNPKKYVTVHQTGNTTRGANAQMHAMLQQRGFSASWHWQVDDKEAIQSFEHNVKCWHASDGYGPGNTQSIAVEICINRDGNYRKSVENGAKLVAYILHQEGLSINKVYQHNHWDKVYRKNCPAQIRAGKDGINWNKFLQMVETELSKLKGTKPKKVISSKKTNEQLADEVMAGLHGSGEARKKSLGSRYNAVQAIVNQRYGANPQTQYSRKSAEQLADEVMAGLHGSGEARKKSLGSRYNEVQAIVNKRYGVRSNKKSVDTIAREVIDGKWGNGQDRFDRLRKAGYNPQVIQNRVNQLYR